MHGLCTEFIIYGKTKTRFMQIHLKQTKKEKKKTEIGNKIVWRVT